MKENSAIIRLGGLGGFLSMTLYILINWVIKVLPPADTAPAADLQAYLAQEAGSWALVHGLRYVAFFCFAVFAAGLFTRIRSRKAPAADGWGVLGLLGTGTLLATGLVTNSIETFVFFDHALLAEHPELFWLLYYLTRFVFTAATLSWGLVVLGFSLGGLRSQALPVWLVVLGIVAATAGILNAVFIVSVLGDGWASVFPLVAVFTTLPWGAATGMHMMWRGPE